jgi:hypothetical protein
MRHSFLLPLKGTHERAYEAVSDEFAPMLKVLQIGHKLVTIFYQLLQAGYLLVGTTYTPAA